MTTQESGNLCKQCGGKGVIWIDLSTDMGLSRASRRMIKKDKNTRYKSVICQSCKGGIQ